MLLFAINKSYFDIYNITRQNEIFRHLVSPFNLYHLSIGINCRTRRLTFTWRLRKYSPFISSKITWICPWKVKAAWRNRTVEVWKASCEWVQPHSYLLVQRERSSSSGIWGHRWRIHFSSGPGKGINDWIDVIWKNLSWEKYNIIQYWSYNNFLLVLPSRSPTLSRFCCSSTQGTRMSRLPSSGIPSSKANIQ